MPIEPDRQQSEANTPAAKPWWQRADVIIAGLIVLAVLVYIGRGRDNNPQTSNTPEPVPAAATPTAPPLSKEAQAAFTQATNEGLNYYYKTKEYDKAEQSFRKSIEIAPDNAVGYNNLGSALNDQKKWDEAIIVLSRAVELDPNFATARNNLAWARAQKAKQGP
ncbi:MAG TPA: tetratricopeptide repeat protein [Gemmatimonadaceae bacterium]|nr:tetratricopeptide repeat protein [Gemmatimonadaceae bacterium]